MKLLLVEILLQHGAQLSDEKFDNLKRAIGFGDNAQIVALIEKYRKLRDKNLLSFNLPPTVTPPQLVPGQWDSALYVATSHNDINTVRKLLSQGINVDSLAKSSTGEYETSLYLAIRNGSEEIAKLLIEVGADINLQNSNGIHPLIMAANNLNMTRLLLDKGALVDRKTPESEITALIQSNQIEVSKLLLEKGANINHASEYGYTPLSRAIILNNLPLVNFLIEQGSDIIDNLVGAIARNKKCKSHSWR